MSRYRLVSFDLDGTLVKGTTFGFLSRNLGFYRPIKELEDRFLAGEISFETCITRQFQLMKGLQLNEAYRIMDGLPKIAGIPEAVQKLKSAGLELIILTDNPDALALYFTRYGFDGAIGSKAKVIDGRLTGELEPLNDKSTGLAEYLQGREFGFEECIHIGDWTNDIPVFRKVGYAIALNAKDRKVNDSARTSMNTQNLADVATQIERLSSN